MARLTSKRRKSLKKSTFGLPSRRAYPMPDRAHAANAKARARAQLRKGRLSRSAYNRIVAKANRVLGKKSSSSSSRKKSSSSKRSGRRSSSRR